MEPDYKAEYQALKVKLLPQIKAPSQYPEDAEVPEELRDDIDAPRKFRPTFTAATSWMTQFLIGRKVSPANFLCN